MNELAARVWVPLQHSPLLWITVTLSAWLVARRIQTACKGALWANPVLIAVALLIGLTLHRLPWRSVPGTGERYSGEDLDPAALDEVLAINVRGCFLALREAIPRMATDLGGGGGDRASVGRIGGDAAQR